MKTYKAVLFDMDGTILDTLDDLHNAVNESLVHFGYSPVSRTHVAYSLGNGAAFLMRHCAPEGLSETAFQELLSWYKAFYDAHCLILTAPYAGIPALMQALRSHGKKLAIISNKPDSAVQELAARFFPGHTEVVIGESAAVRRKPSPDTVLAAARSMNVLPEDCVYIGDTEVDIQTARSASMDCIAVTWGFRTREELLAAGASVLADSPAELEKLLC